MPVRVKQRHLDLANSRQEERHLETLKQKIVGVLLAWGHPINVSIKDTTGRTILHVRAKEFEQQPILDLPSKPANFDIHTVRSILSQAKLIDPWERETWTRISGRSSRVSVEGAVSLQPGPSKRAQFISLNIKYLDHEGGDSLLYEVINRLFAASNFGNDDTERQDENSIFHGHKEDRKGIEHARKQLRGCGKGIDRWPIFSLRILLKDNAKAAPNGPRRVTQEQDIIGEVAKVIEAMFIKFLDDNNFKPRRPKRSRSKKESSNTISNRSAKPFASTSSRIDKQMFMSALETKLSDGQCINLARNFGGAGDLSELENTLSLSSSPLNNTKVPSFRSQGTRYDTEAFQHWSRIKSGNRHHSQEILEHNIASEISPIVKLDKTRNQGTEMVSGGNTSINSSPDADLPSKGCPSSCVTSQRILLSNVKELPSVGLDNMNTVQAAEQAIISPCEMPLVAHPDEVVLWTNPVSKATVQINARTGLVETHQPKSSTIKPNMALSSPRATPGPQHNPCENRNNTVTSSLPTKSTKASWANGFVQSWKNPTFSPAEERIPQVTYKGLGLDFPGNLIGNSHQCLRTDVETVFEESSYSSSIAFSKHGLLHAQVVAQVDKKFILVCIKNTNPTRVSGHNLAKETEVLALVDQHAADERIRVEELYARVCAPKLAQSPASTSLMGHDGLLSAVATIRLSKPLVFEVSHLEKQLFADHASHFAAWGILYELNLHDQSTTPTTSSTQCKVIVKALPDSIAERCRVEPKLLIDLIRGEVWKHQDSSVKTPDIKGRKTAGWLSHIGNCPQGIVDMLVSRSCRSAIMFNDELSKEQCTSLVQRLAQCAFPFQCAHGRPSIIPLVDMRNEFVRCEPGAAAFGTRRAASNSSDDSFGFSRAWKTRNVL